MLIVTVLNFARLFRVKKRFELIFRDADESIIVNFAECADRKRFVFVNWNRDATRPKFQHKVATLCSRNDKSQPLQDSDNLTATESTQFWHENLAVP
jgi:hypothetical protein